MAGPGETEIVFLLLPISLLWNPWLLFSVNSSAGFELLWKSGMSLFDCFNPPQTQVCGEDDSPPHRSS